MRLPSASRISDQDKQRDLITCNGVVPSDFPVHCGTHSAFSSGAEDPQSVWGMGTETAQRVQPVSSAISCRDHSGELTGTSENKQCHLFLLLNS